MSKSNLNIFNLAVLVLNFFSLLKGLYMPMLSKVHNFYNLYILKKIARWQTKINFEELLIRWFLILRDFNSD